MTPRRNLLLTTAGALLLGAPADAAPARTTRLTADPAIADHGEVIQAAIIALESSGGGVLQLAPGIYHCRSGGIVLDPTKTSLIGEKSILDFTAIGPTPSNSGALTLTVPASSSQYGQATQRLQGLALRGPGANSLLAGLMFATAVSAYSSRIALYNLDISGFGDGIRFGDRAYLIQGYSIAVENCGNCITAPPHLADAGEDISFYGCTFGNSGVALCNPGGFEFNFFGSSFDYVAQWFQGEGLVNFYGCHFEKQRPAAPDPLFDIQGKGALNFHGGWIMVSGVNFDPNPKNSAVFNLASPRARATLNDVLVYNLRSSAGALATGPGRLITNRLLGGANKRVDPISSPNADLFGGMGSFSGPDILIDADITSGGGDTARNAAHYGTLSLSGGALTVTKTGGHGDGLSLRLFCPIGPNQIPSAVFDWQAAGAAGAIWIELRAVQKIGQDALGRTQTGAAVTIGPLLTLNPTPGDAGTWAHAILDALNMTWDLTDDTNTPAWVTHLCINVNLIELPQGAQFQIKALQAYAF